MHALGVIELDIDPEAKEKLSPGRGIIVVANHPTLIDIILLMGQIEHGNCIVKQAMWSNMFLGGVVRAANYISNDDTEELLANCTEVLQSGETLVVFPEATRTVRGQVMKLRRGAARIALAARVPLQIVHLTCSPSTLSKAGHWYEIPPRRPCFRMSVGDRLDVTDYLVSGEHHSLASRRLTQEMRRSLMKVETQ